MLRFLSLSRSSSMGEETSPLDSLRVNSRTSPVVGSSLIPIINKLQDILAPVGRELTNISLPQVAVIGSQSSGKSSVLEALVGRDFLPRGCDICTRRPLVLMLENRPEKPGDDGKEWGEFRHLPGKCFYDFSKIRREIQAETERGVGLNKRVSDKQIFLKISSPNVLNMTLVDLPGITKVPVGDQPIDIEAMIRNMIMVYIQQESCIILAVSPANSDLATSDALQMAREADPTGYRTIGVITKLDIMDRGTDARNFLLGKVVPLRLGYIGVVSRSQEDINNNRSIADALSHEEKFFNNHPVYSSLSGCCGIPQLGRKLNQILERHIRTVFPSLKSELNSEIFSVGKGLRTYGRALEPDVEKGVILLNILSKYCEAFSAMLDGRSQDIATTELLGGARIHYIFQTTFVKSLEEVDPCEDLTDADIWMAIQNAVGLKNSLFVPEVPFEVLVKRQIAMLLEPSLQCLRYVYDELLKISRACEAADLQSFPVLRRRMDDIMGKFLRDGLKPAENMIENLIEMEMDYINSSNPNFLGGSKAVELAQKQLRSPQGSTDAGKASFMEKGQNSLASLAALPRSVVNGALSNGRNQGSPSVNNEKPISSGNASARTWGISSIFGSRGSSGEGPASSRSSGEPDHSDQMPSRRISLTKPPSTLRELETTGNQTLEILVTKLLLQSYYDIVRKNVQDLVPKAIMHFLVNHAKRDLHRTFIHNLYREDHFDTLLEEEDDVVLKRKHDQELLQVLEKAVQMLEEVESDVSTRSSHSSSNSDDATNGLPRATTGISSR
ncbi:dynamin-related protein 3A isoform X2 [Morus notabilis]|uniref:dynamin-related protein 3A isoform X2 n=1 Tax=Morus notabilis TaxID=981085 RepID=UPI000CED5806|nr:dynamin-related protein 3A isoform X2 [Morus notabilis]